MTYLSTTNQARHHVVCRTRLTAVWCFLFVMLALSGCGGKESVPQAAATSSTEPVAQQTLNVYGPEQLKPLAELVEPMLRANGIPYDIRIWVGDSVEAGLRGIADGSFDLLIVTERLENSDDIVYLEFVRTPVAVVVNPALGIENLSKDQLRAILSGATANWSEINGVDQPITVFLQTPGNTTTEVIANQVMQGDSFVESARVMATGDDVLSVVEGIPGSIGYVLWATANVYTEPDGASFDGIVTIEGLLPNDPDYGLISAVGAVLLPERMAFFQPMFDWGEELFRAEATQLLAEQFGVELVTQTP